MFNPDSWVVQWKSTQPLNHHWMYAGQYHTFAQPAFILIIDGQARWKINGISIQVSWGQLIAVEAHSVIEVVEGGQYNLSGWLIEFATYTISEETYTVSSHVWSVPEPAPYQQIQLTSSQLAHIHQHMQSIVSNPQYVSCVKYPHLIYEFMQYLYEAKPQEPELNLEHAIECSVEYIHTHYNEVITRKQLAEIAGVSPWYYSRKFSERLGKSPLDYVASFRLYRAQEQLITTSLSSQEIAKQSGYEDTHYFSRRFKQLTGIAPSLYAAQLSTRRIVCLSAVCAEILINLNIIPYAVVVVPALLAPHQAQQFEAQGVQIIETAQYDLNLEHIQQVEPELLIGHVWTEAAKQQLRGIAPLISNLSMEPIMLLHQLASMLHRKDEAQRLQQNTEHALDIARQKLEPIINRKQTVMVLRVEPFGYRYMGKEGEGMAPLLYQHLKLAIPAVLEEGKAWFNPCSLELVQAANPDYLFIEKRTMEQFSINDSLQQLMNSEIWQQLVAVRENRVFEIDTRLWVEGRGMTGYLLILDEIVRSLSTTTTIEV